MECCWQRARASISAREGVSRHRDSLLERTPSRRYLHVAPRPDNPETLLVRPRRVLVASRGNLRDRWCRRPDRRREQVRPDGRVALGPRDPWRSPRWNRGGPAASPAIVSGAAWSVGTLYVWLRNQSINAPPSIITVMFLPVLGSLIVGVNGLASSLLTSPVKVCSRWGWAASQAGCAAQALKRLLKA